jgi:hypothetical protein
VPHELLDVHSAVAKRAALAVRFGNLGLNRDDTLEPWPKLVHAPGIYPERPAMNR